MQRLEDTSTALSVALSVIGYSLCSSTLLLANKLAMEYLPSPSIVSFIQIVFSAAAVILIKLVGYEVDWFEWDKVKAYGLYVVIFVAAIYTNMQALSHSNVETVIVFRACSPIAVGIIEYLFMGREFPSLRSIVCLLFLAFGAMVYCISDSQVAVDGIASYSWAIIYFVLITVEMTYGKMLTSSVKMDSVWGPVLYCNALSIVPMFLLSFFAGDFNGETLELVSNLPIKGVLVLLFSCIVGTLIGYTGWLCRGMVSATTFTLVGVVNKFLTVLLNVFIWEKHSTPMGLVAVCLCLLSGTFYQQAPRRDDSHRDVVVVAKDDVEVELASTVKNEEAHPLLVAEQGVIERR